MRKRLLGWAALSRAGPEQLKLGNAFLTRVKFPTEIFCQNFQGNSKKEKPTPTNPRAPWEALSQWGKKKQNCKCDFCWGMVNGGGNIPSSAPHANQQKGAPAAANPSSTFPMAAVGPRRRRRFPPATIACSGRRSGLGTRGALLSHQPPKFSFAVQPRSQAARAVDAAADAVVCSSEINCATNSAQR